MTSYNSLDTSLLNKRQAPTFMPHNMAQNYHQNQAMNFPYNNFAMQQYHAGYFREEQNKAYNTTTTQDPDEFLSEPTKKIKSEKNSEYSYPNGNPTFPYSQINNSQASNQNNQLKATMQNMMYQNQNFQDHLASTNHKTWENASSGINTADQKTMAVEKPAPKPETNPAENPMAAFQQNSMMQNQYAQAMMAKYYSSMQNSAQAAQYKLYMQQQQQKFMNSNPYMNMTQTQQAHLYWAQQMKNMNAQRQQAYQNMTAAAGNTGNTTENNTNNNPALVQSQAQAQAQAINNNSIMQFLKDQNKSQEVETKPQPQVQPQAQAQAQMQALLRNTNMADLAAKGIHININTASSKSEKQSNKIAPEEPEYNKTSKNHSTDFPSEEDKTTMISPTSFQVQDTNKIEGTAPAPIFDDIYFDINMANLDKFFDADGLGDFNNNVQDTTKKDDNKKVQQETAVPVKKGRGRPKKEDQSQESKNNNKDSKKEVKDVQEKKANKKKAKEEKKEEQEQAFTVADSFFNQANQMPFKQAGGAQGFLENQFEMASFALEPKVPQKDSKEKISLPENNNSMNSLVKEQPEYTNSNSISMMYPGGYQQQQQQQQPNDLFENFEFDFQDAEDFNFDEGTFLFEPFDESRQGEEFESTTEATGQPVRKRGRPRKYAPDGSLLIPDGSGQVRPPINKKASRLQAEREAYEKYLEELKKPYVIHIHHDDHDPEQKVNLTRVGEDHQLYVPPFGGGQAPAKKKSLSPLWAPDMATQEFLDSYLRRLEAVVGQKIAHQGAALRVLKIYNMRVDDVLENVKISPKYYQNYFKVNQRSAKNRFAH